MTGRTVADGDREGLKRALRAVAVQAAVLSAAVHLLWAAPRLTAPTDPRPYVFVLAAFFTLAIAVGVFRGGEYRRLYALGAGTLGAFLVGFAAWNRADLTGALVGDPLAIVGKAAELIGVVAFVALYRLAPPTSVVVERRHKERNAEHDAADRNVDGRTPDRPTADDSNAE